jgi:hypothetical protein
VRQITIRNPVAQRRRHQQHLIGVIGAERLLGADRRRLRPRRLDRLHLNQPPLLSRRHDDILLTAPDGTGGY